jgi:hypothetical protein
MMQSYQQYLPGLIQSTAALQPEVAQGQLNATLATQPFYDALNLMELQKYGVPMAEAGQDVQRSNALAGGDINTQQILGSGGQAAMAADQLARLLNPNYYGVQDAASAQAKNLLSNINLGGLSGGEQAAVERSLAQTQSGTGNLGLANPTNTISNAVNFGGAYNQKLGLLGQALGSANQTAQSAQNSVYNPVNIALGQPNAQTLGNFGTTQYSNVTPQTQNASAQNTFGMGQGFMSGVMQRGLANATTQAQQAPAQTFGQVAGGLGAMGCCFIFLQAYHGILPPHVRACRDRYYAAFPEIATGYKRMAKWLVPLMAKSRLISGLVWLIMVKPLTEYGKFVKRIDISKRRYKWARKFWFTVWYLMGKENQ